jgi:hypothetical protein
MKKAILLLALCFAFGNSFSQNLFFWKHYYSKPYGWYDMGNNVAASGPEELILMDKSTYALTRIPFPPPIRNLSPHNTTQCGINAITGPDQTMVVKGCGGVGYQYDGTVWNAFNSYQGIPVDSISYFLPFVGGSNFFTTSDKLYKYDGSNLTFFDLTNSPYDASEYYNTFAAPNDDVFLQSSYNIAVYHNSTWTVYDTTFFNVHYIYAQAWALNNAGDFTFFDLMDSTVRTFNNASGTWSSIPFDVSMNHQLSSLSIYSMLYDSNGDLWFGGGQVFCRYDGSQFYDYYSNVAAVMSSSTYISIQTLLSNNNLLLMDNDHRYVFNTTTFATTQLPDDPNAVLTGDQLLPSMKDNSGNLWFGACGWGQQNGLMKYGTNGVWSIPDIDAQGFNGGVWSLAKDTGQTIVFGYGDVGSDGPIQLTGTNYVTLNSANQFDKVVKSISIDMNHHYWFGGFGAGVPQGLTDYYAGGITFHPNPSSSEEVYAVCVDSLNSVWVSYDSWDGVYKLTGSTWTHYYSGNSPLPNDSVVDIQLEPGTNALWFATEGGGFARFHNGNWTLLNTGNSQLPGNHAENVYFMPSDTTNWFATQEGLASLHNNSVWHVYTVFNSPLDNSDVESIVVDDNCGIWMCTEHGLTWAAKACTDNNDIPGEYVSGTVRQYDNSPAADVLVNIYKLNSTATDIMQVDNAFTNSSGQFYFYSTDTGTYYFEAMANAQQFPGQLPAYEDTAVVVQQCLPLHIAGDGDYTTNIRFLQAYPSAGSCTINGRLHSSTERTGRVRLVLRLNGNSVASTISNTDGTFRFSNVAQVNYTLWIDKLGFDNSIAPQINLSSGCIPVTLQFELYPTYVYLAVPATSQDVSSLQVYPNPFRNEVILSLNSSTSFSTKLVITDISGVEVTTSDVKFRKGENKIMIKGDLIQPGIYFYRLQSGDRLFTGKLVKLK